MFLNLQMSYSIPGMYKSLLKSLDDSGILADCTDPFDKKILDYQDEDGQTALMIATYNDHSKIMCLLIKHGANVNIQTKDGTTALMTAVIIASSYGDTKIVRLLIEAGATLDIQDKDGMTALMLAIIHNNTELINLLITSGANLNIQNADGNTALLYACKEGRCDDENYTNNPILLLEKGANPSLKNKEGDTALTVVMSIREADHGYDDESDDEYACMEYTLTKYTHACETFSEYKTHRRRVRERKSNDASSLIFAIRINMIKFAHLLIKLGADVDTYSECYKDTALTAALKKNNIEIAHLLIDAGADVNYNSPLMVALKIDNTEIARLLIEKGAISNYYYNDDSELDIALKKGNKEIARLLIEKGAIVNIGNGLLRYKAVVVDGEILLQYIPDGK